MHGPNSGRIISMDIQRVWTALLIAATALIVFVDTKGQGSSDYLIEGDIRLPSYKLHRLKRNAVRISQWKWKDKKIPYVIEPKGFSIYGKHLIEQAIAEYNKVQSCVKWVPRTNENDYVVIKDGYGCHSSIGRDGGPQNLVLGSTCYYKGVVMHEMTHAVGFFHEQARYDRDEYVRVLWDNILDGKVDDFKKQMPNIMDTFDAPYDYGSIMHYGPTTFSKNGKPTLQAIYDDKSTMGQRAGFSDVDIWKIEKLYQCKTGTAPLPVWLKMEQTTSYQTKPSTSSTPSILSSTLTSSPTPSILPSTLTSSPTPSILPSTLTSSTSSPSTTHSTTVAPCVEETSLPTGIPGKVQNFQVVVIENTLRIFWEAPCTSVPLQSYVLTYINGQQQSTITIHPDRRTHYIYTASHPGSRYQMAIAAQSQYGMGPVSDTLVTYSACGHDIVLPENGTISSIHSPFFKQEFYESDVACQWNIKASSKQRLKIKFSSLNLDGTGSCDQDFLMINGERFCESIPSTGYIKTKGNNASIIFLSRPSPSKKPGGFNISVTAVDFKPESPIVFSKPGFIALSWSPPIDIKGVNFNYILKYRLLPNGQQEVVNLDSSLHHFGFPVGQHIGRRYEIELATISENRESNSHKMIVRSACGRNITVKESGRIQNPPLLGTYEPDVVCTWHLKPMPGKQLQIGFSVLDLEFRENCTKDFVAVSSLGRFCTLNQVHRSLTTSSQVDVTFQSNGSIQRKGFVLQYQQIP